MRRRDFIKVVAGSAAAWPLAGHAQQPVLPVVGFVRDGSAEASARLAAAFRKGLNEAGYIEGQNVTVEYERARGLRELHEANDGFAVAVTRTISAPVSRIYAATADPLRRKQWFPRGAFVPSSQTKDKYFRGAWKKGLRLEMGYYAKGTGKAQIAVQIRKLAAKVDVDAQRDAWKSALNKLQKMVEK